jgi:hypothetical protein
MSNGDIKFSTHAIERMGQRDVTFDEVIDILRNGEIIRQDRATNVSTTRLGWITRRAAPQPVHVVSVTDVDGATLIITVYVPDPLLWDATFKRRVK